MPLRQVTDPNVVGQFQGTGAPASGFNAPNRVSMVTDPSILSRFGQQAAASEDDPVEPSPIQPGRDVGIGGSNVAGFASDDVEKVRFLASRLYPNEPLETAVQRFGMRDGTLYHKGDDGKLYEALPSGYSPRSMAAGAAGYVGPAIPFVAGAAAGLATSPAMLTGPAGLAGSMLATGGAAAGGEVARQAMGDYLMGDAATNDIAMMPVVQEGAMNAVGQGIGAGIGTLLTRKAVSDIGRYDPAQTSGAYQQASRFGIDLTPAEATGLKSLQAQQKLLQNMTPTADQMGTFLANRDGQVLGAWRGMLDTMSTASDAENVGLLAREAAAGSLERMRLANLEAARPLYQQAFAEGDRELWSSGLERLTTSPAIQRAMSGAVRSWQDQAVADGFGAMNPGAMVKGGMIRVGNTSIPAFPNLQFWDYTKRMLDDQVRVAQKAGQKAKAATMAQLAQQLRGEIDNLTKGSPYAQARSIYGTGADNLETAMQSALGILAETSDTNILAAARHVFNPRTRSPNMIVRLRAQIEDQDPAAWQALKRLYVQDVSLDALRRAETGEVINPAGKLHKAFMDPRVQENLRAAMGPEEWQHMQGLLIVFKRAASVPSLRSDTAFNQEGIAALGNSARPLFARIARNVNPAQALRSVSEFLTNRSVEKNAQAMVDLVTSADPVAIETMKELRRLSPVDKRWAALFGQLLARGTTYGAGSLLPDGSYEPGQ